MADFGCEMPCYHPLTGYYAREVNESGKRSLVFNSDKALVDVPVQVPCGRCIGCRLDVPDEEVNWKVRNHDNGFIFQIEDFDLPEDCETQAIAAVEALGLYFGAVDVVYNGREKKAYVLEVNSAPGLSGTTLDKYVEVFDGV